MKPEYSQKKRPLTNQKSQLGTSNKRSQAVEVKKTLTEKKKPFTDSSKKYISEDSKKYNSENSKKYNSENSKKYNSADSKAYKTDAKAKNTVTGKKNCSPVKSVSSNCKFFGSCGGCQYLDLSYEQQLKKKQTQVCKLLKKYCPVHEIIGMEQPSHYRNKVQAVFGRDKRGNYISGNYKEGSHQIIGFDSCFVNDEIADQIITTIRSMLSSFKIRTYDEDNGFGLLRYVLVKRGFTSNQIMVVLVTASSVFPSRNNFVKALLKAHPQITTVIQNINDRKDSMILGNRENVLYGKGYIEDTLCGKVFRISSSSFYQINSVQTEKLYQLAIKAAQLTGKETVIDAYCGVGTIGLVAADHAKSVIGVELNKDACRDAITNAKRNNCKNITFVNDDATEFMAKMAARSEFADVVFMDPPRSGSTEEFVDAIAVLAPKKVVYVSCNPETLERDIRWFKKKGYEPQELWPVDMFPWTGHVESVVLISRDKK